MVAGDPKLCLNLISFLYTEDLRLVGGALRTIGNIVTGNDADTQAMVDSGVIPALFHIMKQ